MLSNLQNIVRSRKWSKIRSLIKQMILETNAAQDDGDRVLLNRQSQWMTWRKCRQENSTNC